MALILPDDIKADALIASYDERPLRISVLGPHHRVATGDVVSASVDDDGGIELKLSRTGVYDALPEAFFHPVDRFSTIPASEYEERFMKECELQRREEEHARAYFAWADEAVVRLGSIVSDFKQRHYGTDQCIADIICDRLSPALQSNPLVKATMPFIPSARIIRGDRALIAMMLRKVLADEGIILEDAGGLQTFADRAPRYSYRIGEGVIDEIFVGNEYDEDVVAFKLRFWRETDSSEEFKSMLSWVSEYEQFINDYFAGIETAIRFEIATDSPAELDAPQEFLGFNTNVC